MSLTGRPTSLLGVTADQDDELLTNMTKGGHRVRRSTYAIRDTPDDKAPREPS